MRQYHKGEIADDRVTCRQCRRWRAGRCDTVVAMRDPDTLHRCFHYQKRPE